jgi:ribosomal protein S18 acetylase RimI-like enzyme
MEANISPQKLLELITIRQALRSDLPALEWDGEYIHYRRLYADSFDQVEKGQAILWVADFNGSGIIGQLFVQFNSQRRAIADGSYRAYIYAFRVRPTYRGFGIGTRIIQTAEDDLNRRGFHRVCLNVARDNLKARYLYERLGYHIVAAEPGEWSYLDHLGRLQQVHEPAWRMEKDI